jgi:integrase
MSFLPLAAVTSPTLRYSRRRGDELSAPCTPHGLRHAYASAAHELGLGELTIKALLGHARLGVTSGYVTTDSFLLDAAAKVARYIDRAMRGELGKVVRLSKPKTSNHAHA